MDGRQNRVVACGRVRPFMLRPISQHYNALTLIHLFLSFLFSGRNGGFSMFRTVTAEEYVDTFASDRSHMVRVPVSCFSDLVKVCKRKEKERVCSLSSMLFFLFEARRCRRNTIHLAASELSTTHRCWRTCKGNNE